MTESTTVDGAMHWRSGNKNARNLYLVTADGTELHVGVMFTESLGRYVIDALNGYGAASPPVPTGEVGAPPRPAASDAPTTAKE